MGEEEEGRGMGPREKREGLLSSADDVREFPQHGNVPTKSGNLNGIHLKEKLS